MPMASTIIIARGDFSIPGSPEDGDRFSLPPVETERRFFELAAIHRPDIVVLDLTEISAPGPESMRKIRERAGVPILAIHRAEDPRLEDYRVAGAGGFLAAPINIVQLNQAIQHVINQSGGENSRPRRDHSTLAFGGMMFRPDQNSLDSGGGVSVRLTTFENDVLRYLAMHARRVCSRREIARVLYGNDKPNTDRAVDVIINRLRKKLTAVGGSESQNLLKTEFRRGYVLSTDVSAGALRA